MYIQSLKIGKRQNTVIVTFMKLHIVDDRLQCMLFSIETKIMINAFFKI